MLEGGEELGFTKIEQENSWLLNTPLVVKPDQLIKRRGKAGLLAVNKKWPEVKAWISERMGKSQQVWNYFITAVSCCFRHDYILKYYVLTLRFLEWGTLFVK